MILSSSLENKYKRNLHLFKVIVLWNEFFFFKFLFGSVMVVVGSFTLNAGVVIVKAGSKIFYGFFLIDVRYTYFTQTWP